MRAGLLGAVEEVGPGKFRAVWTDSNGIEQSADTTTRASAVTVVAKSASGGLRFHDLRHSCATWLISSGVPVNDVQKVMGHEQASTTLNRYTHGLDGRDSRVRNALADYSLTGAGEEVSEDESGLPEEEA